MPRAISQVASRRRRKKILKLAKGSRLGRRNQIRSARHGVFKGLQYAYRDRRNRKRDFRRLWITRINAATRIDGLSIASLSMDSPKPGSRLIVKCSRNLRSTTPKPFTGSLKSPKETRKPPGFELRSPFLLFNQRKSGSINQ